MAESKAPVGKVTAAACAGGVVTIGVWVAGLFGVPIPPEVSAAMVVVVSFAAGYIKA